MKYILQYLIMVLLLVSFSNNCFSTPDAQKNKSVIINSVGTIDSLKAHLNKLQNSIDTIERNSYTRIPNKDFENIIDNKIGISLRETVNWWLIVIAALASALGFLVNKYAKSYLQNIIDTKVNQLKKENNEEINRISNHYFSTIGDTLIDFKLEKLPSTTYIDEKLVDDLKNHLKDEIIIITEDKKVKLIDTIMRYYYENNYPNRIKKMIDLIKEYEKKFDLKETTYANAAIAFSEGYHLYGLTEYLNSAIENCNKSIKILPDYGLAFALKLELYAMAISKSFDDIEKKKHENELLRVFKDIENNRSPFLCKELIDRLNADEKVYLKPYIEKLYKDYQNQMTKITDRATPPPEVTNPVVDPVNLET